MAENEHDIKNRPGLDPGPDVSREHGDSQHSGFRPGRHEDSAYDVEHRLNHTAARDDSRAEGAEPELHRPARVDEHAHSRSREERRGY